MYVKNYTLQIFKCFRARTKTGVTSISLGLLISLGFMVSKWYALRDQAL